MNGLGIKVVTALSSSFTLECSDGNQVYTQLFKNHLAVVEPPVVSQATKPSGTSVQFTPVAPIDVLF
jgi:DNA gyrase/topoisomerase IV subunit B